MKFSVQSVQVNVFQATPTSYEMLLATGWTGDKHIDFLVGGEAIRASVLPIAMNCRSMRNVYGPTETTIWSSSFTITQQFAKSVLDSIESGSTPPPVPIGVPISETSFFLVNTESTDLSATDAQLITNDGEEGELWIGGVGVSMGYLNASNLTVKVFISNPFGEGMIYRTGDIVKRDADGNYIFVRRLDDQVKIDGYRIELSEIEVIYSKISAIEQAVALVRNNCLVLYVKSAEVDEPNMETCHNEARRNLPHYMIPKHTVFVTSFPKTANGKLDKKALKVYFLYFVVQMWDVCT